MGQGRGEAGFLEMGLEVEKGGKVDTSALRGGGGGGF